MAKKLPMAPKGKKLGKKRPMGTKVPKPKAPVGAY